MDHRHYRSRYSPGRYECLADPDREHHAASKYSRAPILIATVSAVIGVFIIPFIGLFIGFAVGLLGAEYYRRRDITAAVRAALQAMKAMGLGMLIECGCAITAFGIFGIGVLIHFVG